MEEAEHQRMRGSRSGARPLAPQADKPPAYGFVAVVSLAALVACTPRPSPGAVTVVTQWPGARAIDVERSITEPVEDALAALPGIESTSASSSEGVSVVAAVVAPKTSLLHTADAARTAVAALAARLPADAMPPVVERADAGSAVVARFTIKADALSKAEATRVADDVVARGLEAVPGVARVDVKHGAHREIEVRVDGARARAMSVSAAAVADVLRSYPAKTIVDLAAVDVMRVPEVRVSDVATIEESTIDDDAVPSSTMASPATAPAKVTVDVWKQGGARAADVERDVLARVATLALPPSVVLTRVAADDGAPVSISFAGADLDVLGPLADKAAAALADNMSDSTAGLTLEPRVKDVPERSLDVDAGRASALGVSPADAASALRYALAGEVVSRIDGEHPVAVRVSQPVDEHAPLAQQIFVANKNGALVAVADVATERLSAAPAVLLRRDRSRALVLRGAIHGKTTLDAIRARVATVPLPAGVSVVVTSARAP